MRPGAGWSSLVARRAHNPKVAGSNPAPATKPFISSFLGAMLRIFSVFLLLLSLSWSSSHLSAKVLDYIVALVDSKVILNSEFQEYKAIIKYKDLNLAESVTDDYILEDMITRRVQLDKAQESGIRISDNQLNQLLAEEARRQGREPENIVNDFADFPGGLESYRRYFRDNIIIQELQRIAIRSFITITELEARNFLTSEQGRESSQLIYSMAFLSMPTEKIKLSTETKELVIDDITQFFRQDLDFDQQLKEVQRKYPWIEGKKLDPKPMNALPTIFSHIAPMLSTQEVFEPIHDSGTTYLLKLLDVKGIKPIMQDQVRARHILLKPSIVRNQEQTILLLSKLRERIKNGESFENIARTYTEDPGSKNNGGDLGWQPYNFFANSFSEQVKQLKPLEVSLPFQSPFGWHIAQVIDRKKKDISEQVEIENIRNYLFQQRLNDELPRWINQIREASYVEIRDPKFSEIQPVVQ